MAQIDHQPLGDNPARPRARVSVLLCWAVILSFVGYTAWAQSRSARHQAAATSQSSHAPNLQLELMGRLSIMQVRLMAADDSAQGRAKRDNLTRQLLENISRMAVSPPDKLKAIVITRELRGAPPAIDQLNHNFENIDAGTGVQQDAVDLKGLYTDGPAALSSESHDRLLNDLG